MMSITPEAAHENIETCGLPGQTLQKLSAANAWCTTYQQTSSLEKEEIQETLDTKQLL
jgi:hypothetical protein